MNKPLHRLKKRINNKPKTKPMTLSQLNEAFKRIYTDKIIKELTAPCEVINRIIGGK